MRIGRSLLLVAAALLLSSSAWAQDAASGGGSAEARWEAGARFHYLTANPIIGAFYEKHESVTGYTVGPVLVRRSNDGSTRFVLGLDYTTTDPDDGPWRADGDDVADSEWTEFRDLQIISANVMFGHVFRRGPFGFFFGGGIGLDYVSGSITTFDTQNNGTEKLVGSEPDEKDISPIMPTVIFKMGPQFELGKLGTVSLDVGLHHGLFAGASLTTNLPF